MLSIQSLVAAKIAANPLMANMLVKNLLNTNQYAREIQSDLEEKMSKKITLNSIVVAVSRCKDNLKVPDKIKVKKISVAYPVFWNYIKFDENVELIDFLGEQTVSKDDLFSFKNNKLIIISKKDKKLQSNEHNVINKAVSNFCEIKIESLESDVHKSGILYVLASCLHWADISIIDINIIRDKLYLYIENTNVSFVLETLRKTLMESD